MERRGWGSHNWLYNWSKYFKITTNSVIRSNSFFLKHQVRHILSVIREQPPASPSPTPLMTKPWSLLLSQLALNFLCEKNCGLLNVASWLA